MVTINNGWFLLLKRFLLISSISRLSFFVIEHFENTENFHKFIFRGIKIIYLILSTFPSNLCVQDTILKVLLKIINKNLPMRLESSFAWYSTAKMVLT